VNGFQPRLRENVKPFSPPARHDPAEWNAVIRAACLRVEKKKLALRDDPFLSGRRLADEIERAAIDKDRFSLLVLLGQRWRAASSWMAH
jgi:hypothetical protein